MSESILDKLKDIYEAPEDSLGKDFLNPCLKECKHYRRETAWFRSSVFKVYGDALLNLLESPNTKIEIIAYPQIDKRTKKALDDTISDEDKNKILRKEREKILLKILKINSHDGSNSAKTTEIAIGHALAFFIAQGQLELRFATCTNYSDYQVVDDDHEEHLTHVKRGYFNFENNTMVAFMGSANESHAGLMRQGECFMVFDSRQDMDIKRVSDIVERVNDTWDGRRRGYKIESVSKKTLEKIKVFSSTYNDSKKEVINKKEGNLNDSYDPKILSNDKKDIPKDFWNHKVEAIEIFLKKKKGLLEMATGTGKTSTGLEIVRQLILTDKINKIVICPGIKKDLNYQWLEEVRKWNTKYDINDITNLSIFKHFHNHNETADFISRERGVSMIIVQRENARLSHILKNVDKERTLIIQDEVHGFGMQSLRDLKGLHKSFKYTLGLSATPDRMYDEDGTEFIKEEIGDVIYKFPIESAIKKGILCPFKYYPLKVELSDEDKLKIQACYSRFRAQREENPSHPEESLYMDIAKVYGNAENKKYAFKDFLKENPELIKNTIIFCESKEQAESLGRIIMDFTTRFGYYFDKGADRNQLSRLGDDLDCLISCHILSEGIDIPTLNNIFLLSSPRTRLETIQRIGRSIRTVKDNPSKVANVIDFILYRNLDEDLVIEGDELRQAWLSEISTTKKEE